MKLNFANWPFGNALNTKACHTEYYLNYNENVGNKCDGTVHLFNFMIHVHFWSICCCFNFFFWFCFCFKLLWLLICELDSFAMFWFRFKFRINFSCNQSLRKCFVFFCFCYLSRNYNVCVNFLFIALSHRSNESSHINSDSKRHLYYSSFFFVLHSSV